MRTKTFRTDLEIMTTALKLGSIGFGGMAGMVGIMERELVQRRGWLSRDQYLDAVGAANLIPGPNAVEVIMHCAALRGGRRGLLIAGVFYIVPATLICLLWACLYVRFGKLPSVQPVISAIGAATGALILGTVFRLAKGLIHKPLVAVLSVLVLLGSFAGVQEIALLAGAGLLGVLFSLRRSAARVVAFPLLFISDSTQKLFFLFLKIGATLYGSGYVLFAYLDEALVRRTHLLTPKQLIDTIAAGQITPGPILSSATFAGYLVDGVPGALAATVAIFLPSFLIAAFLDSVLRFINRHYLLRTFLDVVNGASVALIAGTGIRMAAGFAAHWQTLLIFSAALVLVLLQRDNPLWIILAAALAGWFLFPH